MASDQQFCLRWNNHQSTLVSVFDTLLTSETLVDVTLAAEGKFLKAHKVVLSACSPYFQELLAQHTEKHPIVILKDVHFEELRSLIDYMYRGEVNVSQDELSTFIKTAESLKIKGLADSGEKKPEKRPRPQSSTPPVQLPQQVSSRHQSVPASVPSQIFVKPQLPPQQQTPLPATKPQAPPPKPQAPPPKPQAPPPKPQPPTKPQVPTSVASHVSVSSVEQSSVYVQGTPEKADDSNSLSPVSKKQKLELVDPSENNSEVLNSCQEGSQEQSTSLPNIPCTITPVSSQSGKESEPVLGTETTFESANEVKPERPPSPPSLAPSLELKVEEGAENPIEEISLDDDEDEDTMGLDKTMGMEAVPGTSQPGPSHISGEGSGEGPSEHGFLPWHLNPDGSVPEGFIPSQEGSQGPGPGPSQGMMHPLGGIFSEAAGQGSDTLSSYYDSADDVDWSASISGFTHEGKQKWNCVRCGRIYMHMKTARRHVKYECGKEGYFLCQICRKRFKQAVHLQKHLITQHKVNELGQQP